MILLLVLLQLLLLVVICSPSHSPFRASTSTVLHDQQLSSWKWEVISEGQSYCGFIETQLAETEIERRSDSDPNRDRDRDADADNQLLLGMHCKAKTWVAKSMFFHNRHLFANSVPHYEKRFIYYNIEIGFAVMSVLDPLKREQEQQQQQKQNNETFVTESTCTYDGQKADSDCSPSSSRIFTESEKSWLIYHPWYFHVQLDNNSFSLTSMPLNFDYESNSSMLHKGRYSNNIGWLFESSEPADNDFIIVELAINFHPSNFHALYDSNITVDDMETMLSIMRKIYVIIDKFTVSFVSQPTKLPILEYSTSNIDLKLQSMEQSQRPACILHNSIDGSVLSNITIATLDATSIKPRIFCGVFTMASNHHKVKSIRNTWATKCTFFLAFSTEDDLTIPAINMAHMGEEKYNNMWQKTRSIWKYLHEYYIDDFDWFLMGGDDMFYIMENLVSYLMSDEISRHQANDSSVGMYLGRRLQLPQSEDKGRQIYFNSGGPGYLLDQKAAKLYVRHADEWFCFPHVLKYAEDAFLAGCFIRTNESLFPYETTHDSLGRPRFHIYSPSETFLFDTSNQDHWLNRFDPDIQNGSECCASSTIAFHNISPTLMYDINNYLYSCKEVNRID